MSLKCRVLAGKALEASQPFCVPVHRPRRLVRRPVIEGEALDKLRQGCAALVHLCPGLLFRHGRCFLLGIQRLLGIGGATYWK
jgi:hypothetical protein